MVALLEFDETKEKVCEITQSIVDEFNKDCKKLGFTPFWSHITHLEENKPPLEWCTFWSEPYIMITGHVVPCCGVLMSNSRPKLERLSFGNIKDNTLKEIWDSSPYKNFRKNIVKPNKGVPEICLGCRVFNTKNRAKKYGLLK